MPAEHAPIQLLLHTRIAVTRPAGAGRALERDIRALGGTPLRLPGTSLHAAADPDAARVALCDALAADVTIFTSPAAVRFARALAPLRGSGNVLLAPGAGTLRALRRAGCTTATAPVREDSEGILGLPALANVRGRHVAIVGAPGGRGLLDRELGARGARVTHAHVYERRAARLDRRHADSVVHQPRRPLYVLLSSAEALANILGQLPDPARTALLLGTAVVSSERLAAAAGAAGFGRTILAASPHADALLAAVVADRAR